MFVFAPRQPSGQIRIVSGSPGTVPFRSHEELNRTKTMWKNRNISTTRTLAAGLLLLSGCSKSGAGTVAQDEAIGFSTNVARSAVTEFAEKDRFAVWARETPAGGVPSLILEQESVTLENGEWGYTNLRFWRNGAAYDFYAVYPYELQSALKVTGAGGSPYMEITDFDATQSADLMAAEETDLRYTPPARPVTFVFRHLLAQVRIEGRVDPALAASGRVSAEIVSVKLFGMPKGGSCTVWPGEDGVWTPGEPTTADAPFAENTAGLKLTASGQSVFTDDLLLLPQSVGEAFTLEIRYRYTEAGSTSDILTKSVNLAEAGLAAWAAGGSYRYTFTIGGEYILFERPEVVPWTSASGGSITVE